MRQFHTVVLERLKVVSSSFDTEPYEAGWASEAMFFVRVEEVMEGEPIVRSTVQVSADGIVWADEGTCLAWPSRPGVSFARVSHFGGWLRLHSVLETPQTKMRATIQLVLKS